MFFDIHISKTIFIFIIIIFLLFGISFSTKNKREPCPACFDLWHKIKRGEVVAEYQIISTDQFVVKNLEAFPATPLMAKIHINLLRPEVLESVSISAIGPNGDDIGNWTTQAIPYLWGIGIIDSIDNTKIINNDLKRDIFNIPISKEIYLIIPDNGNLTKYPKLYINFNFNGGKRVSTLAYYNKIIN
jgi:hypothetical protein